MYNANIPNDRELPSTARLIKSTIVAAVTAGILLVTVVMPAEYGVDPTGLGKVTGLQKMGEIKMSLAREAEAEREAKERAVGGTPQPVARGATENVAQVAMPSIPTTDAAPQTGNSPAVRQDTTTVTLQPDESTEVKVDLKKSEVVKFTWASDAGKANFDVHADSKALNIDYHGYGKGSSTREEGVIEAAFDGSHGWFWRNRSGAPLTIVLRTEGPYTNIKRVH